MKDSIVLQDKIYISARRVHELFGYTSDYVGQLCRAGKLECTMVGRSWFVTEKSIIDHKSSVIEIVKNKNKEKRREIKKEYKLKAEELATQKVSEIKQVVPIPEPEKIIIEKITEIVSETPIVEEPKSIPVEVQVSKPSPIKVEHEIVSLVENKNNLVFKIFTTTLALSIIFFVVINISSIKKNISMSENFREASVASVSREVIDSIARGFSYFSNSLKDFSGRHFSFVSREEVEETVDGSSGGIAIVPSTGDVSKDEAMKNKIKNSFSDEVVVNPDQGGTSGVITPVFKKAKGDNFVYVLVPVNESL